MAGVVLAQHPDRLGEGLLVQRDGPAQVSRRLVGVREVAAGGQRGRVVLAQHPAESARACSCSGMARPRSPAAW